MSRSATPVRQKDAARLSKPQKLTTLAAIANSSGTVAVGKPTSSEHTFTPRPPNINENPSPRIRERFSAPRTSGVFGVFGVFGVRADGDIKPESLMRLSQ